MKKKHFILCLFFGINILQAQTTVGLLQYDSSVLDNGYVLFSPLKSKNTFLINSCGKIMKTWASNYTPGQSCYLLSNGELLRPGKTNNTVFNVGGQGGIVQKFDWDGNLIWSYIISSSIECQHHDVKALPNGNVLAIVWELKTSSEAIASGRDPSFLGATVWSPKVIEIQPNGASGGNIVWEWHLWDHLIQDYDNTQLNYGDIASNPQLVNINYKASTQEDWIHINSIDYNPDLDQILLSAHNFSEIWIIDHSTSTSEATSHTGGNSTQGGDILYRWGNPAAYNNGDLSSQKFFGQHNVHWISDSTFFQNQIMVFNNGIGRTGGNYSSVEIINPPTNGFQYTSVLPYLPNAYSWRYNEGNLHNFYAQNISGAQQLSNGNVLVCNGPKGIFFEIDSSDNIVWKYVNPVKLGGIIDQGAYPTQNPVFRCTFYPSNFSGFNSHTLIPGNTIENSNSISETCSNTLGLLQNPKQAKLLLYPNPIHDFATISSPILQNDKISYQLLNLSGKIIQHGKFQAQNGIGYLNFSYIQSGFYVIQLSTQNQVLTQKVLVSK